VILTWYCCLGVRAGTDITNVPLVGLLSSNLSGRQTLTLTLPRENELTPLQICMNGLMELSWMLGSSPWRSHMVKRRYLDHEAINR